MKPIISIFHCSLLTFQLILLSTVVSAQQLINSNTVNNTPDSRYTDHGNGTVTDKITGLMWSKCAEGLSGNSCDMGTATRYNWQAALTLAEEATNAIYNDWRLPNIKELNSLVAYERYNPSINSTIFPSTPSQRFWSSSPYARFIYVARVVNFLDGGSKDYYRDNGYSVRLVRSGR